MRHMIVVSQHACGVTGRWEREREREQDVRQLAESELLTVYLLIAALSAESAGRKLYRHLQGDPLRECLRYGNLQATGVTGGKSLSS